MKTSFIVITGASHRVCTMTDIKTNGDAPEDFGPHVHVSKHPVLSHKITILRSSTTPTGTFRAVLREVTYHLGYEATMRLTTVPVAISVPKPNTDEHIDYEGRKLKERIALIPKLRSGLGMENPMLELLPKAQVHHVGMYKVSESDPIMYFNRLPRKCQADVAYILDPVIATSSTVMSMIAILKKVSTIHLKYVSVNHFLML